MKKILLFIVFLSSFGVYAQKTISFPEDFKLDASLLDGMVIAKMPESMRAEGFVDNPGVIEDKTTISLMTWISVDNVLQFYYEIYQGEEDHDDAGVLVFRFASENDLQNTLEELRGQSNLAYLIKDNYLIEVWSDSGVGSEKQIKRMVDYYTDKLQAESYEAQNSSYDDDVEEAGSIEAIQE